jgi:hypothetical protein
VIDLVSKTNAFGRIFCLALVSRPIRESSHDRESIPLQCVGDCGTEQTARYGTVAEKAVRFVDARLGCRAAFAVRADCLVNAKWVGTGGWAATDSPSALRGSAGAVPQAEGPVKLCAEKLCAQAIRSAKSTRSDCRAHRSLSFAALYE